VSGRIESPGLATAARQIAGQATLLQGPSPPDVSGFGLKLTLVAVSIRSSIVWTPNLAVGARLPAICREPAARPVHAGQQPESSRLVLLPLRGRSRASALLQGLRRPDVSVFGLELTFVAFSIQASIVWTPNFTVGARLPAICREPAARPVHAECQADSSRLVLIVPTLRVVTQQLTLCVNQDAERPNRHSRAERGNDHISSAQRYLWETSEVTRAANAVRRLHRR